MDQRLLDLERALARDPGDARARLELANALERDGALERAWRVLADAPRADAVVIERRDALFLRGGAPFSLAATRFPEGRPAPQRAQFRGVEKARVVLGRRFPADFLVDHHFVPRQACLIEHTGGSSFFLVDLNGANGTWVSDERITRVLLADGQRFCLSTREIELEFRLGWPGAWS